MLSDNIRKYRKAKGMSQDELAQQLNVTRQSVSLWENGQAQPTIENILALARIFDVSTDELLGHSVSLSEEKTSDSGQENVKTIYNGQQQVKSGHKGILIAIIALVIAILVIAFLLLQQKNSQGSSDTEDIPENTTVQSDTQSGESDSFDLFNYCKEFAIEKGELNGDYCMYAQESTLYGGYENEYFSISYWGDSDMVEFCLHCPLDETYSINFYLRMRGEYDGKYEYLSSRYYRSDGTSIRDASGYIDPSVFSEQYPLSCDSYNGSADGQNEFMEESRVGMCDLIKCLKNFVTVEQMDCSFGDFGFVNF